MSEAMPQPDAVLPASATARIMGRRFGQADRLIINTLSNYALTFVTMIASLVMTPIVIRHIGQAGLGMVTMVLAPFSVFETLANSFGRSMHRFIPQSLKDSDPKSLSRTFSTALSGYVIIGIVGAFILWLFKDVLLESEDVRPSLILDGALAMKVLVAWLVVGFPFWGYRKGLEAIQRFDVIGIVHGTITLLRMVLVIVIFRQGHGSVTFFVVAQLVGLWLINFLCGQYLTRRLPGLSYSPRMVDRPTLWLMGTYITATILGTFGEIFGGLGFRIFIGKALGLHELGELAAIWTLQITMFRLIDELTNAFAPAISALDAQGSRVNVAKLMISGTKISILVAASMAIVPIAASRPFLNLWLGPTFARREVLLEVLLIVLIPFCLGNTAMHVLYGLGRASISGPIQFCRSAIGLVGAILYVQVLHQGLNGACAIMFGAQALGGVVLLIYGCKLTQVPRREAFMKVLFRPMAIALLGAAVTYCMLQVVGGHSWWRLAVSVASGEIVYLILVLVAGVGVEEWQRISSFLVTTNSGIQRFLRRKNG
jgi:O-antigen/teichoic acid export membrane protein